MTTNELFDAIPRTGLHPDDLEQVKRVFDKLTDQDRELVTKMILSLAEAVKEDYYEEHWY